MCVCLCRRVDVRVSPNPVAAGGVVVSSVTRVMLCPVVCFFLFLPVLFILLIFDLLGINKCEQSLCVSFTPPIPQTAKIGRATSG